MGPRQGLFSYVRDWLVLVVRIFWPLVPLLGVPVATFLLAGPFAADLEAHFRLSGMCLQLVGFLTVVWQLVDTHRRFNFPWVFGWLKAEWARRPRWHSRLHTGTVVAGVGGSYTILGAVSLLARGQAIGATVEQRLDGLEATVHALRGDLEGLTRDTKANIDALDIDARGRIEAESAARLAAVDELAGRIRETATGSVRLSWLGLVFFVLGTVLGSASRELANLF